MLSKASQKRTRENRTFEKGMVEKPWENFWDDVNDAVSKIVVSHRVEHKASGALHAETFYGEGPDENNDGVPDYYTITRPIDGLKTTEVKQIIDPKIRAMVEEKLGGGDPSKVFQEKTKRPYFVKPDGKVVFINRVKIQVRENPFQLRAGDSTRFVMSDTNHHAEVFEYTDKKGNVKWDFEVVPMIEAYRRRSAGEPVIRKELGEGKKFLFSLAPGDTIEIDVEDGKRKLFVVRTVPQSKQIMFVSLNDARLQKEIKEAGCWFSKKPDTLRQVNCRKVYVDPIGKVRYSNT
jgi:CRISPR-associated endonuclease Csn1